MDIRVSIAVNDMERTNQIYRDMFGFTVEGETSFAADKSAQALTGLPQAEVRRSRAQARDSALWFEFVEFKGVDRTPLEMRIQDRGATRLQFRTQNIDAVVEAVKKAGLNVVSHGGVRSADPAGFPRRAGRRPQQLLRLAVRAVRRVRAPGPAAVHRGRRRAGGPGRGRAGRRHARRSSSRKDGASPRSPASAPTRTSASARRRDQPEDRGEAVRTDSKVIRAAQHEGRSRSVDRDGHVAGRGDAARQAELRGPDRTGAAAMDRAHERHPHALPDGEACRRHAAVGDRGIDTDGEFLRGGDGVRRHEVVQAGSGEGRGAGRGRSSPNLSRVDEVGLRQLAPGGGHGIAGSANLSNVELFAKAVPR